MNEARVTDWLKSVGGLATALSAAVGGTVAVYAAVTTLLAPLIKSLGIDSVWAPPTARVAALLLLLPVAWLVWRSYRRFARASRLEQPDGFALSATTPDGLIGRKAELESLLGSVLRNRLVLLDGESGCGKSALISAGLVPLLHSGHGPLPVLIRDWADDWVRGPLATALWALFESLTADQRASLGWTQMPDLAADTAALAAELSLRISDVATKLGRRPLLIADQFDDYQARHREKFLDVDGNWLRPNALAVQGVSEFLCVRRLGELAFG